MKSGLKTVSVLLAAVALTVVIVPRGNMSSTLTARMAAVKDDCTAARSGKPCQHDVLAEAMRTRLPDLRAAALARRQAETLSAAWTTRVLEAGKDMAGPEARRIRVSQAESLRARIIASHDRREAALRREREMREARAGARLARLISPDAILPHGSLKRDRIEPKPERLLPEVEPHLPAIERIRARFRTLASADRKRPLTVLHIGDSHVASDSFTSGIRDILQARYGDAGRGQTIPPDAFKYAYVDQISQKAAGRWRSKTALKYKHGPFGLSGVNLASSARNARLTMDTKSGDFDWVAVTVATGPDQGRFALTVGDRTEQFSARGEAGSAQTFRMAAQGDSATLTVLGGGNVQVLDWASGKEEPGVRYVNFGLIGATAAITKRMDRKLIAENLKAINPDVIVFGYATNDGFDDNFDTGSYLAMVRDLYQRMKAQAPKADWVFLGAADGLRQRGKGSSACGGGWRTPPKLAAHRKAMAQFARDNDAAYWDWAEFMGGACSANRWAKRDLMARDRVHFTRSGYRRSAEAFAEWLSLDTPEQAVVALSQ